MINVHSPQGNYAAHELHHFLTRVIDEPILLESSGKPGRACTLLVKPSQSHEVMIDNDVTLTTISGRSETSLLHGVYCFLEKMGYVFTARGPVQPAAPVAWPAPFTFRHTPTLPVRGIRQHLNFPMDISCLPLEAALEYVRNMARLKFNFMTFHLYPNQGWLQMDYKGYKVGIDPNVTLYYSERHSVCQDQTVRAQSANKQTWFIPEFESHYRKPEQHKLLRSWLREVMRCAKACGMTVAASIEAISPSSDKDLAAVGEPLGPELYARVTAELAFAALEQYPDTDQIEIITQENENYCPSVTSLKDATDGLRKELAIPESDLPAPVTPDETEARTAGTLVSTARTLKVEIRAFELIRQDKRAEKLLGRRTPVCATYTTLDRSLPYLGAVIRRLLPPDMRFAMLASYSSRCTAAGVAAVNLSPEVLARTRLYAWCEFDGEMYLFQNECEGLHRCMRQTLRNVAEKPRQGQASPGPACQGEALRSPAELVCNHWRTSENELAINYLAQGAFFGTTPREFYRSFLNSLMGSDATPALTEALTELDEVNTFTVKHLFNAGFCFLSCWSLRNVEWRLDNIAKYKAMLHGVAKKIRFAMPRVSRPEGIERCELWVNRLEASQVHCDVISHLRTMREMVDWTTGKLPADKRDSFRHHAQAAREMAQAYVALCAQMLPDRMSEGTLTNYEHVMFGLLDTTLAQFVGDGTSGVETRVSNGPPPPIG